MWVTSTLFCGSLGQMDLWVLATYFNAKRKPQAQTEKPYACRPIKFLAAHS